MCSSLAIECKRNQDDIVVISMFSLSSSLTEAIKNNGIKFYTLDKNNGFDFSIIKKLKNIIINERPNVIHTHLGALKYVYFANKKTRIPVIHTIHNMASKEVGSATRLLQKHIFRKKIAIPVALSEIVRKSIIDEYGLKYDVPVIYNGTDLSKCIKKETYSFSGPIKIITVARLTKQKNHMSLIFAFQKLCEKYDQIELHLVGDGDLKDEIQNAVKECSMNDRVFFHGIINNVYPLLNECDIFVLPSIYEGVPISVIEAMGTAMPIVATSVGGLPNMITNEENGVLCLPSSESIFEAIVLTIENEKLREKIGKNAYFCACSRFSSSSMYFKYKKLYQSILAKKES